jgi:hypothetical protein
LTHRNFPKDAVQAFFSPQDRHDRCRASARCNKEGILMRHAALIVGLAVAVAAPSLARAESCQRYAHDRKVTGTVVGGLGGALIGNAITHNTTGALLGGVSGAVVGNQVARVNCDDHPGYYRSDYPRGRRHHHHRHEYRD